jgi:phage gp16-like protein
MLTKKQITVLHVAKSRLCLDDETYRDILEANAGVRSAKNLDYKGFLAVMRHFEVCGFKRYETANRKTGETGKQQNRPGMASDGQIRKIKAVWLTLAGSYCVKGQEWKALRGFLNKRFGVSHENFLDQRKAWEVIEAIKKIGQRQEQTGLTGSTGSQW